MSRFFPITKRIFRWFLYLALGLVALLFIFIESFDRYVSSEKGTRWWYKDIGREDWTINFTPSGVRYIEMGDPDKQPLLLVHGAPGSVMDWSGLAKRERIFEKYRLLIVVLIGQAMEVRNREEPKRTYNYKPKKFLKS